jgi:hypothetical protein
MPLTREKVDEINEFFVSFCRETDPLFIPRVSELIPGGSHLPFPWQGIKSAEVRKAWKKWLKFDTNAEPGVH